MNLWNCKGEEEFQTWSDFGVNWWSGWRGIIYSLILATGAANTLRLPREISSQGGIQGAAPFLVAHTVLSIILGIPLLVLKFGLSKFSEQGALKIWRAVPLFKGLGYVKLCASFMVAVYHIIYVSISCAILIWTSKGPVPLVECTELHRDMDGYHLNGTSGQKCMSKTFLRSVFDEPLWYSVTSAVMVTFWLLISLCLIKLPTSFQKSMYIFGGITLAVSLFISCITNIGSIESLFDEANWKLMLSIRFWYSAFVQMLFSLNIGFGYITTTAVSLYARNNIFWSALSLALLNLCFGWFSISLWHGLGNLFESRKPSIIMILVMIYDTSVFKEIRSAMPALSYILIITSAFTSALMLLYPIIWCLHSEGYCKKTTLSYGVTIFGGFISLILYVFGINIVTLIDQDIVPMLITGSMFIELIALLFIYGLKSIKHDIEFIIGSKINYLWYLPWCALPFILMLFVLSKVFSYMYEWSHNSWKFAFVILMFVLAAATIIIWASWITMHQEGYGLFQKLMSALKPSKKWGPVDAVIRNKWLQYKLQGKKNKIVKVKSSQQYQSTHHQRSLLRGDNHFPGCIHGTLERMNNNHHKEMHSDCINCMKNDHCVYLCEINYINGTCWVNKT